MSTDIHLNRSPMEAPRARLLKEVLREAGVNAYAALFTPEMLGHTEDGKPFFPDLPQIHFSLSHSGEYIACAFSDEEVGLDLQECSRPRTSIFRIAKRFFSQAEYEAILALSADKAAESCINDSGSDSPGNPDDPECLSLFYRLWSIKEAYLKYIGCGLSGELNSFLPDPLPLHNDLSGAHGLIRVLEKTELLTPAEYSLLPAPEGFTMAVSAQKIPSGIVIRYYDASGRS